MAEKRRGLGRGLGALIPSTEDSSEILKSNQSADAPQEPAATQDAKEESQKPKASSTARMPRTSASRKRPSQAAEKAAEDAVAPQKTKSSAQQDNAKSDANSAQKTGGKTSATETPVKKNSNVSRETKKKRADMGAALRATSSTKRPADFFFGADDDAEKLVPVPGAEFAVLNVKDIHPNRKQPRTDFDEHDMEELVHSIKEIGVLQPIVVRPSQEDNDEKYELVMGERRWRATQRAGIDTIPAIVRETKNVDLLRDALLENLHRSQLNPIEEAAAYQQLLDEFETTQDQLAQRIGRSRPQISNTIRLLKLPALVQRRVAAGILSAGHARALLSLKSAEDIEKVAQKVVNEGLSVRAIEELVVQTNSTDPKPARKAAQPQKHHERLDYIADAFADKLDTNVKIQLGSRKGKMTIEFASVEDLNRIISVLDPGMEK
ncbi:ParB/RepB/Spo0J family partition protein [Microbacterium foliorum]|uniref:ParB/RepB/Spo0J family partition protein n=1 Tax=Rothia terrae TaxID=396015 RepID=UPI0033FF3134